MVPKWSQSGPKVGLKVHQTGYFWGSQNMVFLENPLCCWVNNRVQGQKNNFWDGFCNMSLVGPFDLIPLPSCRSHSTESAATINNSKGLTGRMLQPRPQQLTNQPWGIGAHHLNPKADFGMGLLRGGGRTCGPKP